MEKSLKLCAIAALFCASMAFAQPSDERNFLSAGVKGAVGMSSLYNHIPITVKGIDLYLKPAVSLTGGIHTELDFRAFMLVPEVQYSWYRSNDKRIELQNSNRKNVREIEVTLHSIEIPLLLRFNMPFRLFVELGPQVGFVFHSKTDLSMESSSSGGMSLDVSEETENLNTVSYGPAFGLGVRLTDDFLISARGHIGLREYADDTRGYPWLAQLGIVYNFFKY